MSETLYDDLLARLGEDCVSKRRSHREQASEDASSLSGALPDFVVRPQSLEDILIVVEACTRRRTPVTARGNGTSRAGGPIPIRGGVALDMTSLDQVLEIRPAGRFCRVQSGVTVSALNAALAPHGLCWGPFDSGESTVGGLVSRNALGPFSAGFGTPRDTVLGMNVVMGSGEIVRAGHHSRVAASGYDLSQLVIGSEGTLGIIADVALRLTPLATVDRSVAYGFSDDVSGARAALSLAHSGIDLAACQWLGSAATSALRQFKQYDLPAGSTLLIRLHGHGTHAETDVERALERLDTLLTAHEGQALALGDPFAAFHWLDRAIAAVCPNTAPIRSDLAFPIDALESLVDLSAYLVAEHGVALFISGPVTLGALDVRVQANPEDIEAWDGALDVRDHLMEVAADKGGASSAGHGVGLDGRRYMKREHGLAIKIMGQLKAALDPAGILNPGKILP